MGLNTENGGHSLTFDSVQDGKVYLRNPWGPGAAAPEGLELEDPRTGLVSLSEHEFLERFERVITPADPQAQGGLATPAQIDQRYVTPDEWKGLFGGPAPAYAPAEGVNLLPWVSGHLKP